MADCVCFGYLASMRNFVTKEGKPGCNFSISATSGDLYPFYARKQLPVLDFGTPVTVEFGVSLYNGKPNNLVAEDLYPTKMKEVKEKNG